jgi:hypothetical protein
MRTAEPDEDWVYCFEDDSLIREAGAGWEAFDWYVEEGLEAARAHVDGGGTLDDPALPTAYADLADWVAHVRARRADGALDADDTAAIEGLPGWTW